MGGHFLARSVVFVIGFRRSLSGLPNPLSIADGAHNLLDWYHQGKHEDW